MQSVRVGKKADRAATAIVLVMVVMLIWMIRALVSLILTVQIAALHSRLTGILAASIRRSFRMLKAEA